jgi:hypothetical protein
VFLRRAALAVTILAVTAVPGFAAAGSRDSGKLKGLFTFSAGGHTWAIRGVVTLVDHAGRVHRIEVDRQGDPHLKAGRFSESLSLGTYRISCHSHRHRFGDCRDGGGCGAYLSGDHFDIGNPSRPVTTIKIRAGRTTDVRINCFGHG